MSITKRMYVSDRSSRKVVTPITGVLSLVIGISGVMLFFHLGEGLVKGVHEWMGIAFVAAILVHLAINWKAFKQHFRKSAAWIGTGVVSVICIMFLITSLFSEPHENPMRSIMRSIETTAVSDLAPVFKLSQSELMHRFGQAGVEIETGRETLRELAGKSEVDQRRLLVVLLGGSNQSAGAMGGIKD